MSVFEIFCLGLLAAIFMTTASIRDVLGRTLYRLQDISSDSRRIRENLEKRK